MQIRFAPSLTRSIGSLSSNSHMLVARRHYIYEQRSHYVGDGRTTLSVAAAREGRSEYQTALGVRGSPLPSSLCFHLIEKRYCDLLQCNTLFFVCFFISCSDQWAISQADEIRCRVLLAVTSWTSLLRKLITVLWQRTLIVFWEVIYFFSAGCNLFSVKF